MQQNMASMQQNVGLLQQNVAPIQQNMASIQQNIAPMQQNMSFNKFPAQWNQNNNPWSSNRSFSSSTQNGGNWSALDSLLPTSQPQKQPTFTKQPMNQMMMTQKQPLLSSSQTSEKGKVLSKDDIIDLLS